MSLIPPANQPSPHTDASAVPVAEPGFEVGVQAFWQKNRGGILLLCGVILLGIIGREAWQYFQASREKNLQEEFAQVSDKPERLSAFAEANSGHPLSGVAYLQMADQKYEAADYKNAESLYTKAAASLKNETLLGRAKLGAAISQINSGNTASGEASLKAVGADQKLPNAVRAEATYHLASVAVESGKRDEVGKLIEEITKLDLSGPWSQRATMLLGSLQDANAPQSGAQAFKPEIK